MIFLNSILYYPTIDIVDEVLLKRTLLYWDEICTIVPYSQYPLPNRIELLQEHNCYRPIYPKDIFTDNTDNYELFFDTLQERLLHLLVWHKLKQPNNRKLQ